MTTNAFEEAGFHLNYMQECGYTIEAQQIELLTLAETHLYLKPLIVQK